MEDYYNIFKQIYGQRIQIQYSVPIMDPGMRDDIVTASQNDVIEQIITMQSLYPSPGDKMPFSIKTTGWIKLGKETGYLNLQSPDSPELDFNSLCLKLLSLSCAEEMGFDPVMYKIINNLPLDSACWNFYKWVLDTIPESCYTFMDLSDEINNDIIVEYGVNVQHLLDKNTQFSEIPFSIKQLLNSLMYKSMTDISFHVLSFKIGDKQIRLAPCSLTHFMVIIDDRVQILEAKDVPGLFNSHVIANDIIKIADEYLKKFTPLIEKIIEELPPAIKETVELAKISSTALTRYFTYPKIVTLKEYNDKLIRYATVVIQVNSIKYMIWISPNNKIVIIKLSDVGTPVKLEFDTVSQVLSHIKSIQNGTSRNRKTSKGKI